MTAIKKTEAKAVIGEMPAGTVISEASKQVAVSSKQEAVSSKQEAVLSKQEAVAAKQEAVTAKKAAAPAKKTAAVKEAVRKTAAKSAGKAAAAKAAGKRTKTEIKTKVYVQYGGKEISVDMLTEEVKKAYAATGHKASEIKTVSLYVKPEEDVAYFVVNGEGSEECRIYL